MPLYHKDGHSYALLPSVYLKRSESDLAQANDLQIDKVPISEDFNHEGKREVKTVHIPHLSARFVDREEVSERKLVKDIPEGNYLDDESAPDSGSDAGDYLESTALDLFLKRFDTRFRDSFQTNIIILTENFVSDIHPLHEVNYFNEVNYYTVNLLSKLRRIKLRQVQSEVLEIVEASEFLLAELKHSVIFKAIILATDENAFKVAYPWLSQGYEHIKFAHLEMAKGVLDLHPILRNYLSVVSKKPVVEVGKIVELILDLGENFEKKSFVYAAKHDLIIKVLVSQWKGKTHDGLNLIIDVVQEFERRYGDNAARFKTILHLVTLIKGVSDPRAKLARAEIREMLNDSPLMRPKLFANFIDEARSLLSSSLPERAQQKFKVQENVYDEIISILKDAGVEDDFWEIQIASKATWTGRRSNHKSAGKRHVISHVEKTGLKEEKNAQTPTDVKKKGGKKYRHSRKSTKIDTKTKTQNVDVPNSKSIPKSSKRSTKIDTKPQTKDVDNMKSKGIPEPPKKKPNDSALTKHLHTAEQMCVIKLRKLLLERPELCPNCLQNHTLSECPNLNKDPRENLAAYIVTDYEEQTNRPRLSFLKKSAKRAAEYQ